MSIYNELNKEQQDEVDTRIKLLFGLCTHSHDLKDQLMEISKESNSALVKLKKLRES